jgi:hypothetical protein
MRSPSSAVKQQQIRQTNAYLIRVRPRFRLVEAKIEIEAKVSFPLEAK